MGKKIWGLSEFRNDDDFGRLVEDLEHCKATGEPFYLCKESTIDKAFEHAKWCGVAGAITGTGVAILAAYLGYKSLPAIKTLGAKIFAVLKK